MKMVNFGTNLQFQFHLATSPACWKAVLSPLTKAVWKSYLAVLWELAICRILNEHEGHDP